MKKLLLILILFLLISSVSGIIEGKEGSLIKLKPKAIDKEGDNITYTFSEPFNEKGEWTPGYEDAGEYTVTVTASDGKSSSNQEIVVKIENINRAPIIEIDEVMVASEGETIIINPKTYDPDGDKVKVQLNKPFIGKTWKPKYGEAGQYEILITASDGRLETTKKVSLLVMKTNRPPEIYGKPKDETLKISEGDIQNFSFEAKDADEDVLYSIWKLDGVIVSKSNTYTYNVSYNSAGEHTIEVLVTDGNLTAKKQWTITVRDVNRKPNIKIEPITIKEGETVDLNLPLRDQDGDLLTYSITKPLNKEGKWKTGYDDEGIYTLQINVTDGKFELEIPVSILVRNVDRKPFFRRIDPITISESDTLKLELDTFDPDGNKIETTIKGLQGATINGKTLVWTPGYDYVTTKFNLLRLFRTRSKTENGIISVCANKKCVNQTLTVTVLNKNRPPKFEKIKTIIINETDKLKLEPTATDPDGDKVRFYYLKPANKKGIWRTNYDDEGIHKITIGATDGQESTETTAVVIVKNVNQKPKINKIADRKVNEGETVWINFTAKDKDNQSLKLWIENMPEGAIYEKGMFKWTPGFEEVQPKHNSAFQKILAKNSWLNRKLNQQKKVRQVTFAASDGKETTYKTINIVTRNKNRRPEIHTINPGNRITATIGQPTLFKVNATDPDGDKLTYKWKLSGKNYNGGNKIKRTFTTLGQQKVKVLVTDNKNSISTIWIVNVVEKQKQ